LAHRQAAGRKSNAGRPAPFASSEKHVNEAKAVSYYKGRMKDIDNRIADTLNRGWRRMLVRGIAAILFGIFTWLAPGITLVALVLLFGCYALVDGALASWIAVAARKRTENWWLLLLAGLVGIGVGIITLTSPGVTAVALLFYMAIWAIARGVLEIVAALRLRDEIEGEWLFIVSGLFSVAFGVLLMAKPGAGALTVLWLVAAYAVVFGIVLVMLAFKARGFTREVVTQQRERHRRTA
jgi:uncharacterized membrane protein HdeD (DUF308 family)